MVGFLFYEIHLSERFPELSEQKEKMEKRQKEISIDYPEYYDDERFYEKASGWIVDFCNQIPDEKQREKFQQRWQFTIDG